MLRLSILKRREGRGSWRKQGGSCGDLCLSLFAWLPAGGPTPAELPGPRRSPPLNSFWSMMFSCRLMAHHVLGIKIYCSLSRFPSPHSQVGDAFCKAWVLIRCITKYVFVFQHSQPRVLNQGSTNGIQRAHNWDWEKNSLSLQFSTPNLSISLRRIGNGKTCCLVVT